MIPPASAIAVAIPLHLDTIYTYLIPADLAATCAPGKRVVVPFGRRRLIGMILEPTPITEGLKPILGVLDDVPLLTPEELDFLRWAASYYLHPLGEVIRAALPAGLLSPPRTGDGEDEERSERVTVLREPFFRPVPDAEEHPRLGARALQVYTVIAGSAGGELSRTELYHRFGDCHPQLKTLVARGLIIREEREVYRDPFREETATRDIPLALTASQSAAHAALAEAIRNGAFAPYLLHGVTGSGKTEVYLQAIAAALELGRNALVLVPEIGLTPQLVQRFRRRFGDIIAVLHSGLSEGERYDQWRRIRRGEVRIVIGARSAIFAPLEGIGIIVVDEEHDGSYKQGEGFRYNARDLALVRGKRAKAVVVLGSATPLVTTIHASREGKLAVLRLPERVGSGTVPQVEAVDLRGRRGAVISPRLMSALRENLEAGGQTLLFLNRRGFATYLVCADCGHVFRCPNCSVTLTYHRQRQRNVCHYCDFTTPAPTICPQCNGAAVTLLGQGTERLEEEVREQFPQARIARMDRDTTSGKGGHARILKGLEEGSTDILVGTQMIAKGHDFPGVTLVGVLAIDASLNLPDFRSAERTFQLLTQVTGRAGRGEAPGRVIVQTLMPDHYAVARALGHDSDRFYDEELGYRADAGYPPFSYLALVHLSGNNEDSVGKGAGEAALLLRGVSRHQGGRVEIYGPAASPLSRVRGRFRWQILLKSPHRDRLRQLLLAFRAAWREPAGIRTHIDIDPVEMM